MAEQINVSENTCEEYWSSVKEVIDTAGSYAWAVKLKENLENPDTAWKVESVFRKNFDSDMARLDDAIRRRRGDFYKKVAELNVSCRQNGLRTVKKPDTLLDDYLIFPSKRTSYKGKMDRKKKKGIICPLQDFEKKKGEQKK